MSKPPRLRADAARNRNRLIEAARQRLTAEGEITSLDTLAKAAGVGTGTLYRHFPTRGALVEAVYESELDGLDAAAESLCSAHPALDALRIWMDRYVGFVVTKRAMRDALQTALTSRHMKPPSTRARVEATIARFLLTAAGDGTIRTDIEAGDIALALAALVLAVVTSGDEDQSRRLLNLLVDGLRPRE